MKRLLLDLDGVLVDFVRGACRLHNQKSPYLDGYEGFYFNRHWNMSDPDLYTGMDRRFWQELDWTADGRSIFNLVDSHFGPENTCILTTPCPIDGCYDGKLDWIKMHLPKAYHRRYLIGTRKEFCAGDDRVLIDDRDENIDEFVAAGGHGLLIPRPWNRGRKLQTTPLSFLIYELGKHDSGTN